MLKSNSCSDIEPILQINCCVLIINERLVISKKEILNTYKNFSHRDKVKFRKMIKKQNYVWPLDENKP